MRSTPEEIVRIAPVPASAKPLRIFDVAEGECRRAQIARECEWVIITHIPEDSQGREAYALYYVDGEGWPGDKDEFNSLQDAMAYAETECGIQSSAWSWLSQQREEPHGFSRFAPTLLRRSTDGSDV